MRILFFVCWALASNLNAAKEPVFTYECKALMGQEKIGGTHDVVYAFTNNFSLTEKNLSKNLVLKLVDFKNFVQPNEEFTVISNGKKEKGKHLPSFKGSNLEPGFEVTIRLTGNYDEDIVRFLVLNSDFELPQFSIGTQEKREGKPEEIENHLSLKLDPAKNNRNGRIELLVNCRRK